MIDLSWNPEYTHFIVVVLWSAVGFACYYFLSLNKSLSSKFWKFNPNLDDHVKNIVLQRFWGLLFLGGISSLIVLVFPNGSLGDSGLRFHFHTAPPWWSFLVVPVILLAGFFNASNPGNLALYPQIRVKDWTPGILALSSISWIVFLVAYEFLFRGFLLFASLEVMGPVAAIALNCSLYAFAHFYKGPVETFGAIPLGILLCYITLLTGNIWSAVIIHTVMALSNEWYSIRANPDLKLRIKNRD